MDAGGRAKHGCPSRGCTVCRGAMDGNERRMYKTAWMQEIERSMDARAEDVRYVVRTYRHAKAVMLNLFQYLFLQLQ